MIQLHQTPTLIRHLYPSLTWSKPSANSLYLTFDDGPHQEITPWVLQQLSSYQAKATFFCVGNNLDQHAEIAKKAVSEGHLLANHTYDHLKGWNTPDRTYFENIERCEKRITELCAGTPLRRLFRPPYGRIRKSQSRYLASTFEVIMWSHLAWDFDPNLRIGKAIRALKKVPPGSIIVFHDSEKAYRNLKQLLPPLMDHWSSENHTFSTL